MIIPIINGTCKVLIILFFDVADPNVVCVCARVYIYIYMFMFVYIVLGN